MVCTAARAARASLSAPSGKICPTPAARTKTASSISVNATDANTAGIKILIYISWHNRDPLFILVPFVCKIHSLFLLVKTFNFLIFWYPLSLIVTLVVV
jgi:hypothetical protein